MKHLSLVLRNKKDSVTKLAQDLNVDLQDIVDSYPDEPFQSRLTKELLSQVLEGQLSDENWEALSNLCNLTYNRDIRSAGDYGIDLVFGWLVEDIITTFLQSKDFITTKQGVDLNREFLRNNSIKSDIDVLVEFEGKSKLYDIYFDSQGYWYKNDQIDLRESKWRELTKTGAGVLCISNYGFAIIDADTEHSLKPNPLWGGKMCATVMGIKDLLVDEEQFLKVLLEDLTI